MDETGGMGTTCRRQRSHCLGDYENVQSYWHADPRLSIFIHLNPNPDPSYDLLISGSMLALGLPILVLIAQAISLLEHRHTDTQTQADRRNWKQYPSHVVNVSAYSRRTATAQLVSITTLSQTDVSPAAQSVVQTSWYQTFAPTTAQVRLVA